MEKYVKPEMTVDDFRLVDVLTASFDSDTDSGSSSEPTTRPNSTPYIPIP